MMRPAEYAVFGDVVLISGRTCAYLLKYAGLNDFRKRQRGSDSEVARDLLVMALGAQAWLSSGRTGTQVADLPEPAAGSEQAETRLSATQAGTLLGITSRAIRKAISEGRLHATRDGREHRIDRTDIELYRTGRRAR
jgi:excisionase family DNA binding protein